jgi:hypothetical protein
MHKAIIDLKALMAMSAEVSPGLNQYLSSVVPWIEQAPKVLVDNPAVLLAEIKKLLPADPAACFGANPGGVKLPFPSLWVEFTEPDGCARGLLLRGIAPDLIHTLAVVRSAEPVALEKYTGSTDAIFRWLPIECEFFLSLKGPVGAKEKTIRKVYEYEEQIIDKLIAVYGNTGAIPLPAHGGVCYDVVVDGFEAFKPLLRDAYAALCGIYDSGFYMEKLSPGDGVPAYCLRSMKVDYSLGHPEATKMLMDTIKTLPGCTLCGATPIASGGALDVDVDCRTAGGLYALCPSCHSRPDRIQRVRAVLKGKDKKLQLPLSAAPAMLQ